MSGPVPTDDDVVVLRLKLDGTLEVWSRVGMSQQDYIELLESMIQATRDGVMKRIS